MLTVARSVELSHSDGELLGAIVGEAGVLDRAAVAALLGVDASTITTYLRLSRPGGMYERHPFPAPDGRVGGRVPWWRMDRADEIRAWDESRPRRAAGGRPRKNRP